jgi:hypothetical protein
LLVVGVAYLLVTVDPLVRRRTWQLMDRPERTPAAVG